MNLQDLLDPEIAPVIEAIPFLTLDAEILPLVRTGLASGIAPEVELSGGVERSDHLVPADPPVPVRVHRPLGADGVLPCVYTMHGGGFVLGSYVMDDLLFDSWCPKLGIVGVSVDYRLAPETPYPGPLEDCYAGLRLDHEHADELGIDPARIGVTRHRAPAAAWPPRSPCWPATAARCRLAFQLLDSPDARRPPARRRRAGRTACRSGAGSRTRSAGARTSATSTAATTFPYTAAPARADRPSGLPPAFVVRRRRSTGSATRTSTTRCASTTPACRPSCTSTRARPTAYQIATDSDVCRRSFRDVEEWLGCQLRHGAGPTA